MVKLLIFAFLYKEMLPKDVCRLFFKSCPVGMVSICMNMKVLILLVAIGFFVCLFHFLVFCSSQSCTSTWVSFNCLLSQSDVKDYGGLFFF